jgi:hypothetical protein
VLACFSAHRSKTIKHRPNNTRSAQTRVPSQTTVGAAKRAQGDAPRGRTWARMQFQVQTKTTN